MEQKWDSKKIGETALGVVRARELGQPRKSFPGDIPPDLETAYAVQAKAISQWPGRLAGFKVGGIPPHLREQFPAEWLAGPVFNSNVFTATGEAPLDIPVIENGFAAYEPELIFQIRSDAYQIRPSWTALEAKETIERLFLGAEIAASPNVNVNALGPGSIISDFGNNAGIILGREIPLVDLDNALNVVVETRIDDEFIGKCAPNKVPGGPLGALAFLLEHLNAYHDLYELPETLFVSSGAITGVHESHVGTHCEMAYERWQTLRVRLVGTTA